VRGQRLLEHALDASAAHSLEHDHTVAGPAVLIGSLAAI